MKYIKTFEKYSLPNPVSKLSDFVCDFVIDKFDWWVMRKGLANYSEIHVIKPPFKDKDFPVSKIKVKTIFVLSDKFGFSRTGVSHGYSRDEEPTKMVSKLYKNGNTEIGIETKIYVPKNKKSFSKSETIKNIKDMITHELTHSYKSYKFKSKNIPDILTNNYLISKKILHLQMETFPLKFFNNFIYLAYLSLTPDETEAHLAQSHELGGDYWVDFFKKIRNMDSNKIKLKIKNELENSDFNESEIIKIFDKDNIKTLDDLINFIYNIIQNKKEYIFRKLAKIKYQTGRYRNKTIKNS